MLSDCFQWKPVGIINGSTVTELTLERWNEDKRLLKNKQTHFAWGKLQQYP